MASQNDHNDGTKNDLESPEINYIVLYEKLIISGGEASSEENFYEDTGFQKSYDGNPNSFWHSKWGVSPPYILTYNIKDAERLDYIIYHPRPPPSRNGNFGEVEILISTYDNPQFLKVMDYDFMKSSNVTKVILPSPVLKPKAVTFIINSGFNDNGSCSEIEFCKSKEVDIFKTEIPLGSNTFVSTPEEYIGGFDDGNVSTLLASNSMVFSTFFRVNESGNLVIYLKHNTLGNNIKIEVTCKTVNYHIAVPKLKNRQCIALFMCNIDKVEPGYLQVDFKGLTVNALHESSLLLAGSSAESINYVNDSFSRHFGLRGPSVHITYIIPNDTAEWFYNEVTVPVGFDPVGSYFMANGFSYGYFGIQVNSKEERRILFSVWSPFNTDDPNSIPDELKVKLIDKGTNVITKDFGNEGSGGQSYLLYNWRAGNTYKFLTRIRPFDERSGYSEFSAYFYDIVNTKWLLIAKWIRPQTTAYHSRVHSFIENFSETYGHRTRKAQYGNQWIYTKERQWIEIIEGKLSIDETGQSCMRMDYKGGTDDFGFFLQNGGFFNDFVKAGTTFKRKATNSHPDIDFKRLQ